MRRGLFSVIVLAAPFLTAGCTVPVHAVVGVGVDGGGRIVGYLRVCSHQIDGATLFDEQEDKLGSWTAPASVTGYTSWTLASPASGWKVDSPLGQLLPATDYTLYGWTSDNSSSGVGATFTLERLARLKPDQVLHWSGTGSRGDVYKVDSIEEFKRSACEVV